MRPLFAALAVSVLITTPTLAHETLLEHQHEAQIRLVHAGHDHKPHVHIKKAHESVKKPESIEKSNYGSH